MSKYDALQRHMPVGRVATGQYLHAAIDACYLRSDRERLAAIEKVSQKVAARLGGDLENMTVVVGEPSEFADLLPEQSPGIGLVIVGIKTCAEDE